ncbi:MAG: CD225/dispanin family protein [Muribaculaceae bacterium]|nr:CD225/dispanin family protein [Muribaculaceae bacterium]
MKKYYLYINGETIGPLFLSDITEYGATEQTYIWYPGLDKWTRISDLPDIAEFLQRQQEPQPPIFNPSTFGSLKERSCCDYPSTPPANNLFPRPNNYLAESIMALLFCFPLAIVAIIKATKVNRYYDEGDVNKSYIASTEARNWFIASVAMGLFSFLMLMFF